MDPDDQHDVARGDEAIDQGLAYQLEQCRYAILQRDEQLRKALERNSTLELAQTACLGERDEWKGRAEELKQQLAQAQAACGVGTEWPIWDLVDQLLLAVKDCELHAWVAPVITKQLDRLKVIGSTDTQGWLSPDEAQRLQRQLQEAVELLLKSSPRDFSDAAARLQWVQQRDAFIGRQKGGTA